MATKQERTIMLLYFSTMGLCFLSVVAIGAGVAFFGPRGNWIDYVMMISLPPMALGGLAMIGLIIRNVIKD